MAGIEPVFFLHRDIGMHQDTIRPFDVCKGLVVGDTNVDGAQNVWGVWRVYLKNKASRATLLSKGLSLTGRDIQLYDKNPRTTNNADPNRSVEKIIIKDLPLSVDNSEIYKYLQSFDHLTLTTGVKYSHERNEDGELTSWRNGDRYIYAVAPIFPVLPNTAKIVGMKVRLYHMNQKKVCKACGQYGHRTRDYRCEAYDPDQHVVAFRSRDHVLSNFYPCDIPFRDDNFKSLEHAYQYTKAVAMGELDIAWAIKNAPSAFQAFKISTQLGSIDDTKHWEEANIELMRDLVHIKMLNVPEFKDALLESVGFTLAEATNHPLWASGLGPDMTEITKPEFWPGRNMMGVLLMEEQAALVRNNEVLSQEEEKSEDGDSDGVSDVDEPVITSSANDNHIAPPSDRNMGAQNLQKDSPVVAPSGNSETAVMTPGKDNESQHSMKNAQNDKKGPMDKYTTQTKRKPSSSPESSTKKDTKMPRAVTKESKVS